MKFNAKNHSSQEDIAVVIRGHQLINAANIKDIEQLLDGHTFTTEGMETEEFEIPVSMTATHDMCRPIHDEIGIPDCSFWVRIHNNLKGTSSTYVTTGSDLPITASIQRELNDAGEKFRKIEFTIRRTSDDVTSYEFSVNDCRFIVQLFTTPVPPANLPGLVCIEKDATAKPIAIPLAPCLSTPTEEWILMPKRCLEFTHRFCDIVHGHLIQTDDSTVEVSWHTVKFLRPIKVVFEFMGYDEHYTPIITMDVYGQSRIDLDLKRYIHQILLMNATGNQIIINGDMEFLENAYRLNMIDNWSYFEMLFVVAMITKTDANLHLKLDYVREMIDKDEHCPPNKQRRKIVHFIHGVGIICGHTEIFKDLDDATRDRMIKICMDVDREDCANVLRQTKND